MSNISVNTITDASGGSTASINGLTPQASNMQPFNRIINGAMTIDQRNAGATLSLATIATGLYAVDRFQAYQDKTGVTGTVGQSTDAPAGFKNSFGVTITTGATSGADDQSFIQHMIEGLNIADLGFGTANAQPITLSFWVKSSITGTNGFGITNSTASRCYVGSYTVNSANTWEKKTVTIAGDTSGTWLTTNGIGIRIRFNIGSGSNRLGAANSWGTFYNGPTGSFSTTATSGATFYITGVQLEAGSTASSFAHENYGDTLQKCQRYYQKTYDYGTAGGASTELGWAWYGTDYNVGITSTFQSQGIRFETTMRNPPTMVSYDSQGNSGKCTRYRVGSGPSNNNAASIDLITTKSFRHFGQGTAGTGNIAFHYTADAEL